MREWNGYHGVPDRKCLNLDEYCFEFKIFFCLILLLFSIFYLVGGRKGQIYRQGTKALTVTIHCPL